MVFVSAGYKEKKNYLIENLNENFLLSSIDKKEKNQYNVLDTLFERIKKNKKNKEFIDITFSPDKSISLLAFLTNSEKLKGKIIEAHNNAVKNVYKILEKEFLFGRDDEKKIHSDIKLNSFLFTHYTSRAGDPQLHSHLIIDLKAKTKDGKPAKVDTFNLYIKGFLSTLYISELYHQLINTVGISKELIEYIPQKRNIKITGISEDVLKKFSKRRAQIINYAKNKSLKTMFEQDETKIKKNGKEAIYTRNKKDMEVVLSLEDKITDWKLEILDLLKTDQVFIDKRLRKLIENYDIKISKDEENIKEKEIKEYIKGRQIKKSYDEFLREREFFSYFKLIEKFFLDKKSINENFSPYEQLLFFEKEKDRKHIFFSEVVSENVKDTYKYYSNIYTTTQNIEMTIGILDFFKKTKIKNEKNPFKEAEVNRKIIEFEIKEKIKLTEEQRKVIKKIEKENVAVIVGDAGTGKTTLLKYFANNYDNVIGTTHTRVAVEQMQKVGIQADTIERFLKTKKFTNLDNSLIIIDEASMISLPQLYNIIEKIKKSNNVKIILIGDIKQFPPIDKGSFLTDYAHYFNIDEHLKNNIRQKRDTYSELVRELVYSENIKDLTNKYSQFFYEIDLPEREKEKELEQKGENYFISKSEAIMKFDWRLYHEAVSKYMINHRAEKESAILVQTKIERDMINRTLHSMFRENKQSFVVKVYDREKNFDNKIEYFNLENYKAGDKIKFNSGIKYFGIRAGSIGYVKSAGIKLKIDIYDKDKNFSHSIEVDKNNIINFKDITIFEGEEKEFFIGERIVFLSNDKKKNLTNGEIAIIKSYDTKTGELEVESKITKEVKKIKISETLDYNFFDYAYAITTMKSQGATFDYVIPIFNFKRNLYSFNEIYVALSRGKSDLSVFTDNKQAFIENCKKLKKNISLTDLFSSKIEEVGRISVPEGSTVEKTIETIEQKKKHDLSEFSEFLKKFSQNSETKIDLLYNYNTITREGKNGKE